jgi:Holliday junction resolvase RusA-like endonuclease
VTTLLIASVEGVPGPKGSVNAFCVRCTKRRLPPAVVVKEQSDAGVLFRKVIARELRRHPLRAVETAIETRMTFYVHRQQIVRAGLSLAEWVPSHRSPVPIHRNSGDVEKHVRTVHDALMDAGVIQDDSQVSDLWARKRWADEINRPGLIIEIREVEL